MSGNRVSPGGTSSWRRARHRAGGDSQRRTGSTPCGSNSRSNRNQARAPTGSGTPATGRRSPGTRCRAAPSRTSGGRLGRRDARRVERRQVRRREVVRVLERRPGRVDDEEPQHDGDREGLRPPGIFAERRRRDRRPAHTSQVEVRIPHSRA